MDRGQIESQLRDIVQANKELLQEQEDSRSFGMDNVIQMLGGSSGRFQIMSTMVFMVIFAVGSQFFYSMPFYAQYPALKCFDEQNQLLKFKEKSVGSSKLGDQYCSKEIACDRKKVDHYEIDWSHKYSLKNWMTDLNMICEEPYKIGFLGSFSFISFSVGGLLISKQADVLGRKNMVLVASLVTPIGILFLQFFAFNIMIIYLIIFVMGLTYNGRSSGAYIYASEFLEKSKRINIGTSIFTFSGVI